MPWGSRAPSVNRRIRKFTEKTGLPPPLWPGWSLSLFGAVPFVLTGEIPSFVDALFEIVSGFTTTGSSILSDVEALSHVSLFWRSFSHWIGGMGGAGVYPDADPCEERFQHCT